MKKFQFKTNIIKRRKLSKSSLLTGLLSAALLGYSGITYLENGFVPLFEKLIDQIGLNGYENWVYLGLFSLMILLIIPAVYTILKKKTIIGGTVAFDEETLEIKKGREQLVIPEKELTQLNFELKTIPKEENSKDKLLGGSYMKIPTTRGTFECELDLKTKEEREELLEMIEFLKIEHDVKVSLKEIK